MPLARILRIMHVLGGDARRPGLDNGGDWNAETGDRRRVARWSSDGKNTTECPYGSLPGKFGRYGWKLVNITGNILRLPLVGDILRLGVQVTIVRTVAVRLHGSISPNLSSI